MKSIFNHKACRGQARFLLSLVILVSLSAVVYCQVPIDYELFVPSTHINKRQSNRIIPASQNTVTYTTALNLIGGRVEGWVVVCGENNDEPLQSAGVGAVRNVSITGRDLTVEFGSVGGKGTLIVALKVPPTEDKDSLYIEVIDYNKYGTPFEPPSNPVFKLGSKSFSIRTFVDSTGTESTLSKSYVDGFGRIVQSSGVGASPSGGDLINIFGYDLMGRQTREYLPFVADTAGALVYNPSFQRQFYANKYKDTRNAAYAYSKTDYDGSPLGIVRSTSPAGDGINSDSPGGGTPTVYDYSLNRSDSVFVFELDSLNPSLVRKQGYYANGDLRLKSSSLKMGSQRFDDVTEYYDCQDRKVMVQSGSSAQRVYYVYDRFDRLCYTIPQICADSMLFGRSYGIASGLMSQYCYHNVYDRYGNVIREYTPGAGESIYIYDRRYRLVLAQDAGQRAKNLWAFSKYDIFDRPVMVGVVSGGTESEYRQAVWDDTAPGESRIYTAGSQYPYTDICYPILSQTWHEVYGINYYDGYDWTDIPWQGNVDSVNYAVQGLLTRTESKVLGQDRWLNKVVYYDTRYRKVLQYSDLYPSGTETSRMSYDFQDRLTGERVEQHTSAGSEGYSRTYDYDTQGRLLQIRQKVDGDTKNGEVALATYTYDNLGERLTRRFNNASTGTLTRYSRNLTGTDIVENGPVHLEMKYGNEVSYFGKKQPYTRLVEFTWLGTQVKNGYAYDYDKQGRLTRGAYLEVQGSSSMQDEYDILLRNSIELTYDTLTDNITSITRSGRNMPMTYTGYRMSTVQLPGQSPSETFRYDSAGNISYDGLSRQSFEYNTVGRLQAVWNKPENETEKTEVSVYTNIWLTYDKSDNPDICSTLHELYPDYFEADGDINPDYRARQWNGAFYDFYYIPKKYPLLSQTDYIDAGVGHTTEYMGGTPSKTVNVYYLGPEKINTNSWLKKSSRNPPDPSELHDKYPDYFMFDGSVPSSYLIPGTTNCYMIPERYPELGDMGYVGMLTGSTYSAYYYSMEPPLPGYLPVSEIYIDNFIDIPVRQDKFVRFSVSQYSSDFINYAARCYPKYFDGMTGRIHHSYHIRDDYYYLPKEYSSLLRDPFTEFDFVEWDVIDYYPGLGTPPASIEVEVPVSGKKRMETVYNGQGEKLSVRYFSGDTLASEIFYNGSFTYESEGGGQMKLRDMLTPEGVVVKAGSLYNYRCFMRDYLGNVRYVSGIYQYTDYDPLGKIIYSSNLDKNVYLYEGKERIPDIAEEYESVYDFGARYYNPLYGRWFAPDPEKQGINPYIYCGNNHIMLVDPNGRKFVPGKAGELIKAAMARIKALKSERIEAINTIMRSDSQEEQERARLYLPSINKSIRDVKKDIKNIELLEQDEVHLYKMEKVEASEYNVVNTGEFEEIEGKTFEVVTIQYIDEGTAAHERTHVAQSLREGELRFGSNNRLVNAAYSGNYSDRVLNRKLTMNEVNGYRMQYSYNGGFYFVNNDGERYLEMLHYNDIRKSSIAMILNEKGNPAYEFANKYK